MTEEKKNGAFELHTRVCVAPDDVLRVTLDWKVAADVM